MRLFHTELVRFWSRRIVWVTSAIVIVLSTVIVTVAFTRHSADAPTDQDAVEQAERATEDCVQFFTDVSEAERDVVLSDFGIDANQITDEAELDDAVRNTVCWQDPTWFRAEDNRFHAPTILVDEWEAAQLTDWSEQRPDSSKAETYRSGVETHRRANDGLIGILPSVATFYLVVAIIVGASFVGGEYKSGTVENLLLWEPRRVRVMLSKFAAGFVSSFALTYLLLAWLTGLLLLLATVRGTTDAIDTRFWIDIASTIGRGALVGGLFFVASMSVSVIARTTTAAVGVILGWFVVSNLVIQLIAKWLRPWELFVNASAFIREADGIKLVTHRDGWTDTVYHHGYLTAGLITVGWVAALAIAATVSFARRDID